MAKTTETGIWISENNASGSHTPQAGQPMPCVATIGFFDGVHRGHQFLISHVISEARRANFCSVVVTFDRHPRQVLQQEYQPELLTTLDEKLRLLRLTGIDDVEVLHFDKQLASLTARDFMQQVLRDRLNVRKLVIGYDNRFGHNRAEGFDDYVRYGRQMGIDVVHNPAFLLGGIKVSSSVVRSFLRDGDVEMAGQCLGRSYAIAGKVVGGYQEGRKIGFPTANLDTSAWGLLIPKGGVYAVRVHVGGDDEWHGAMMDIGTRPTFGGSGVSLEVNIFDYHGNLYGKTLYVAFVKRVRDELKFSDAAALAAQLGKDETQIRQILKQ